MELPDPPPLLRRYLGGAPLDSIEVKLKTTTLILGGAPVPRQVDMVDIIRVPTVRGHLRFWWRALYAHECSTAAELDRRERDLWGGVGGDQGTRSQVEVRVKVDPKSAPLAEHRVEDKKEGDDAYYALWARPRDTGWLARCPAASARTVLPGGAPGSRGAVARGGECGSGLGALGGIRRSHSARAWQPHRRRGRSVEVAATHRPER